MSSASKPSSFFSANPELVDTELRKLLGESLRIDDGVNAYLSSTRNARNEQEERTDDSESLQPSIKALEELEKKRRLKEREETLAQYRVAKVLFDMTRDTGVTAKDKKKREMEEKVVNMTKSAEQIIGQLHRHSGHWPSLYQMKRSHSLEDNLDNLAEMLKMVQQMVDGLDRMVGPQIHHPRVNFELHPFTTMHHHMDREIGSRLSLHSPSARETHHSHDIQELFNQFRDPSKPAPSMSSFMGARKHRK